MIVYYQMFVLGRMLGSLIKRGEDLGVSPLAPHSIFELSLFGNESPNDFQLYSHHAPSCSEPLNVSKVFFTLVSQLS